MSSLVRYSLRGVIRSLRSLTTSMREPSLRYTKNDLRGVVRARSAHSLRSFAHLGPGPLAISPRVGPLRSARRPAYSAGRPSEARFATLHLHPCPHSIRVRFAAIIQIQLKCPMQTLRQIKLPAILRQHLRLSVSLRYIKSIFSVQC